jgi:hypothetical protein
VVGGRAFLQLLEGRWLHHGVADIQHQMEAFFQVVCPLNHYIQGLKALRCHVSLSRYFRLAAIEVEPDKYAKLLVQNDSPVPASTAWPRRCDRLAATLRPPLA